MDARHVWRVAGYALGHGRDAPVWVDLRAALHTTERPPREHHRDAARDKEHGIHEQRMILC